MKGLTLHGRIVVLGIAFLILIMLVGIGFGLRRVALLRSSDTTSDVEANISPKPQKKKINLKKPVRPIPSSFPRNTHLPDVSETKASDPINPDLFSAGRDLIYIDDKRVWWESDNDKNDTECDHSVHKSMEIPLKRLIELVAARNGILEVQDSYRATGVHNSRSLHKEGRAIDVTCDELGLEKLAQLAWAAGFDWVYYEAKSRGGAHVHASVKRKR